MSIGNANLHQRGEIPEIVKLPNGRIRIIRRFHKFTREDVDNAALGSTMGNFGDLDTTGEQIANQGYTDCRLISVEVDTRFNSVSNADNAVLVKTYETLTSSFVQITDDTVEFDEDGLKKVTRVYRAISGTTSTNVIGTTNFVSDGTTVYLASSKLDDNDAFAELTEEYIEGGLIDTLTENLDAGVRKVTQTFLFQEGTTVGPVISRNTQNVGGLPTITVTTLQDSSGNAINNTGENVVREYESLVNFTYPGVVSVIQEELEASSYRTGDDIVSYEFYLTPPAESLIEAVTYVIFQDSGELSPSDFTYDSAIGLWNPTGWAQSYASGIDINKNPFSTTKALRGYRANTDVDVKVIEPSANWNGNFLVNGRPIQNGHVAKIGIRGGPSNPEGNRYVLSATITPAYEDASGNLGYKKKITVATIPNRSTIEYAPPTGRLITSSVFDFGTQLVRRSGSLDVGEFSSPMTQIALDWDYASTINNDYGNSAYLGIRDLNASGVSNPPTYHRVTNYNSSTGVVSFTPSKTVNTGQRLYYTIYPIERFGSIRGKANASNKVVLQRGVSGWFGSSDYDDLLNGVQIKITNRDLTTQTRTITDFNGTTQTATVNSNFNPPLEPNVRYELLQ